MKLFPRRTVLRLASIAAALLLLFALAHTPPARRIVLRLSVRAIERLAGGALSIESLDYRLWRGEGLATSVRWSDGSTRVEAAEVRVRIPLSGPVGVEVRSPRVRSVVPEGRAAGGRPRFPAALLHARISLEDGSFFLEWPQKRRSLEASSIRAKLEPGALVARGSLEAATLLWKEGDRAISLGPGAAEVELSPAGTIRIEEARLEKGSSFAIASGTLEEIRFEHSIEAALLSEIDPDLAVGGVLEGEGVLTIGPELSGEGILRSSALAVGELGTVAVEAPWKLAGSRSEAEVSFDVLDSETLAPLSSRISGRFALRLTGWDPETMHGDGVVRLEGVSHPRRIPLTGELRLRVQSRRIDFEAPRLTAPGISLAATGIVSEEELRIDYRASVRDLSRVADLVQSPFPVRGALELAGRIRGPLVAPAVEARVLSGELGLGAATFSLNGEARLSGSRLEIETVRLQHASGGTALVQGALPMAPDAGAWNVSARLEELPLAGVSEGIRSGRISGTAEVSGKFSRPELHAAFETEGLETAGGFRAELSGESRSEGLAGSAFLRLENPRRGEVSLPEATLRVESDGSSARVVAELSDGREVLAAEVDLERPYPVGVDVPLGNLPFAEARELFPTLVDAGVELEIEGRGRLEATLADPGALHYRLDVDRILGVYRGIALGATSRFTIEGTRESLAVEDLTLVGEDTAIGIDGVVPLSRDGGVFLHARGATRLELLKPWFPEHEPSGRANVDVRLEGALPDPWLRGELGIEEASARIGGVRVSNVAARADWGERVLTLESFSGEVLGGTFRVEGELPPQLDATSAAKLRFDAEGIEPLRLTRPEEAAPPEAEVRVAIAGELTGTGLDPSRWSGRGEIASVRMRMRDVELENGSPARWSFSEGSLELEGLSFASDATFLVIDGEARPFDEPISWTARAKGRVDHELSRVVLADLGLTFSGVTDLDLLVASDPGGEAPFILEGRGSFERARLLSREPALAFTNVSGEIEMSRTAVRLKRLTGDAGGGKVEAEGTLDFEGARIGNIDLRARADSVRLSYPEGLRSEIEGSFRLSGDSEAMRLSGEASLARALFSRDINVESRILQSLSAVSELSSEGSLSSRIALDLRVRAPDAFRIDNNLARMEASVNVAVTGTLASPELGGIASARPGGRFRFGGNTYRVESGRIQFRGYPAEPPEIDITARTSVGQYDLRLVLRGSTDELSTELTSPSHPQLSRGDVASLLLTGRTLSEISGDGRAVVGERMASYLGSTLADLAQLGFGEALPFDLVTVEPALIAGEADPGARFTLGAELTEELSLVYSIGLNDAEDQIWVVDYELPARTRSQIVRDQENEFTFGLSQELRFHVGRDEGGGMRERPDISEIRLTVRDPDPAVAESDLRNRLETKGGRSFDYWKAWEDAERMRAYLRERDHLEAIVDVSTTISDGGAVVVFAVALGPRIHFRFPRDEPGSSLRKALREAWTGGMGDAFLASDLVELAEGKLYEDRYYSARVEVSTERSGGEVGVIVDLDRGPRGKKVIVELEGNELLSDAALLRELPPPGSAAFHDLVTAKRPRLKQLLALRYASEGFISASIGDPETAFDPSMGEYRITLPVVEGARFHVGSIAVEGASSVSESELRLRLPLREGEPFRVTAFVQGRSVLASHYRERGYPEVKVDSRVEERPGTAELEVKFVVNEGPRVTIGSVAIAGNKETKESVIRREVDFEPGDTLSSSALSRTERRLYELGIFQSAEVIVEEASSPDERRDLRIQVSEGPDLELDYGARFSTGGFFEVLTELRAPNLFGRAQHASLRSLLGSDRQIFRFAYHSPYLSSARLDTDFFLERAREYEGPEPIEGGGTTVPFTSRTWTFTAQQTRPLVEDVLTLQWSYGFDRTVTEIEDFLGSVVVQNNHIFTGSLIGDYRDSLVRPTRGSLWSVTVQAAPEALGSDLKMVKLYGQLFTYLSLGRGLVWAGGYRVGVGTSFGESLDEKYGFRAGGPSSVRGFDQNSLGPIDPFLLLPVGGTGLLVFNQELRFPLFWRLGGVGFYDAGNAFRTVPEMRLSDLRQNVGAGLRFELPFGLLRLDGARVVRPREGESPWRFVFSLGHAF